MQKKSCRYLLPFEHMHERERQTDRSQNGSIDNNGRKSLASDASPNKKAVLSQR